MAAPRRGAFLVFEGIDRSGKTTQSSRLVEHLRNEGISVEHLRFPDRTTPSGQLIDGYLKGAADAEDAAIHLLFSANRWEKKRELLSKLHAGTTLVVDRYATSGVAYTAAKQRPGLDLTWCKAPDIGLPAPDLVIYMRLSREAAAARAGFGEERYEQQAFQEKVSACFEELANDSWCILDASQSQEDLQQQVVRKAEDVIAECKAGRPIRRLWDLQNLQTSA